MSSPKDTTPPPIAGSRLGRYDLLGELAKGAMGTVYKAKSRDSGRLVALKVLSPDLATSPDEEQEFRARFEREAQIAAKVQHPGIVHVLDSGTDPAHGLSFIAMEYVEGETLRDRLARLGRLPLSEAVDIGIRLSEALHAAHALGIVHRDVKPSNVLLGSSGAVKITDFGIARVPMSDLTRTGVHVGTPNFMSPEQVKGRTADARSDVFSLGVIIYWMVTGKRPFGDDDPARVAYRTVNVLPVPPHELSRDIPVEVSRVILHALEKDPARRHQTAKELAASLSAARGPSPPAAPAPSPIETQEVRKEVVARTIAAAAAAPARATAPSGFASVLGYAVSFGAGAALVAIVFALLEGRFPSSITASRVELERQLGVGQGLQKAGSLEEARGAFEEILRRDPEHHEAKRHLERVSLQIRERDAAPLPVPTPEPGPPTTPETSVEPPASEPVAAPEAPTVAVEPPAQEAAPTVPAPLAKTPTIPTPPASRKAQSPSPEAAVTRDARLLLIVSHRLDSGSLGVLVDGTTIGSVDLKTLSGAEGGTTFVEAPSGRHRLGVVIQGLRDGKPVRAESTITTELARGTANQVRVTLDKAGTLSVAAPGRPSGTKSPAR